MYEARTPAAFLSAYQDAGLLYTDDSFPHHTYRTEYETQATHEMIRLSTLCILDPIYKTYKASDIAGCLVNKLRRHYMCKPVWRHELTEVTFCDPTTGQNQQLLRLMESIPVALALPIITEHPIIDIYTTNNTTTNNINTNISQFSHTSSSYYAPSPVTRHCTTTNNSTHSIYDNTDAETNSITGQSDVLLTYTSNSTYMTNNSNNSNTCTQDEEVDMELSHILPMSPLGHNYDPSSTHQAAHNTSTDYSLSLSTLALTGGPGEYTTLTVEGEKEGQGVVDMQENNNTIIKNRTSPVSITGVAQFDTPTTTNTTTMSATANTAGSVTNV